MVETLQARSSGARRRRRRRARDGRMLWGVASMLLAIGLWALVVITIKPPSYVLPAPWEVILRAWKDWALILSQGTSTVGEIVTGLVLSAMIAIPLGVFIVAIPVVDKLFYPILIAFNSIPKVALAPLFVVWFGYGIFPRVLITVSIAFFPVLVSTVTGLKSVDPEILRLARSMRAQNRQVFLRVRLPNALPSAFAGLKVATSLAVIGAIIGEFVASDRGWGYMLVQASGSLDTSLMFAVVICLAVVASLLFYAVDVAERTVISWHASHRQ
jgi:NitT/TauT family transport system permease protein